MHTDDLVTIGVLVYNQHNTIIELLESIKNQTYQRLELIISDDCSTDDSVKIISDWLKANSGRFERVEFLKSDHNLGISANRNKNLEAATGEWYKPIDGDDVLCPSCISDFIEYIQVHPNATVIFGRMIAYEGDKNFQNKLDERFAPKYFNLSSEDQLQRLIFGVNIFCPQEASIFNRERIKKEGISYDNRIPMIDDFPFWINVLKAQVKLDYMDKPVMYYRNGGISNSKRESLRMYQSGRLLFYYYLFPEWYKKDPDDAINTMLIFDTDTYNEILHLENTKAYRLGKFLIRPYYVIKNIITHFSSVWSKFKKSKSYDR